MMKRALSDTTIVRQRLPTAMVVGAKGRNVLRVIPAFEQRRMVVVRSETIAAACDRIAHEMPHVVLALVPPTAAEQNDLADRAAAVGAIVVHMDPELDDETVSQILDRTITTALERRRQTEAADEAAKATNVSDAPPPGLDDGWGE